MYSLRRSLLVLIPALAVLGACGGGDDDDSDGGVDGASSAAGSGSNASASPSGGGDSGGSSSSTAVDAIRDGVFGEGKVHVEVAGDKDVKIDAPGNGLATGGYTLLTFGNDKASVILAFQADSKEAPGALSITTEEFATAGEWGTDCTVTVDDGANELKGEFDCKDVEAVDARTAKAYEIRIKGSFSVPR